MTNTPQHIIDKLKEEQSKSPSKKKKVGCVITDGEAILSMGHNVPTSFPYLGHLQDWYTALENRASEFNKEEYAHAEFMAVKALNKSLFRDKLSVYITHEPCEVCKHYLNHHLPYSNIVVVDMDNQPTTDKAETKPKDYYTLPNGIECKDISGEFMGNIAQAIQYLWRAGKKTSVLLTTLRKQKTLLTMK